MALDRITEGIFSSMRVSEAVKFRPASLEIFRRLGCDAWKEGGEFVAVVCQNRGLRTQDLLQEFSSLPIPVPSSPWEELPAHFLIDYLTVEHRQLLHSDFPAFRSLLEIPFREASGGELFRILLDVFQRFNGIFRDHIQEEEDLLFPAILMNEHALINGGWVDPAGPDSGRLLMSCRLFREEGDMSLYLEEWTDAWKNAEEIRNHPKVADIADQVLRRLENKIRFHCELERNRLYPIASRIEGELVATSAF